jgi:CBS domain-containing protein
VLAVKRVPVPTTGPVGAAAAPDGVHYGRRAPSTIGPDVASQHAQQALGPEGFLRGLSPFDELDEESFAAAMRSLEVIYVTAGTRILTRGGEPSEHLHVVRKGTALLSRDGVAALSVEPGEWFGLPSVLDDRTPEFDVDAIDDLLVYRLPRSVVRDLARVPAFGEQVTRGLASRLRATADGSPRTTALVPMAPVATLVSRDLVALPAEADIGEVARTMREQRVSSVVLHGDPPAIVTTRDLRDRVLAEGLGPETPAAEVSSRPILTVDAQASVSEARTTMLERSLHHLGIERDGRLVAVVTTGDLVRHDASSPLHVQRELAAVSRAGFARVPERLHATVAGMLSGGLSPIEITRTVSLLTDVLVRRAIALAVEALGPPPVDFAWLTLGSDARREQTLLTDQDHALVHEEVDERGAAWFHALATDVTGQLVTAGLPRCPGGVMATNWYGSVATWRQRFERWLAEPDVRALYETSIFLDNRVVAGSLDVSELDEVVRAHRGDGVLLARMAAAAGTNRPPIGMLHRLRATSDGTVELKAGGINPVVAIARVLAVEAGSTARSTVERLETAVEHGGLGRDGAEELIEAFRFLQTLRLEHHLDQWRTGEPLSNRLPLDALTPTRRRHLKETFVAVSRVQHATIHRLGGEEVSR